MQNTIKSAKTTAAKGLRITNVRKGTTQSEGIRIKNAKNTATKSCESLSVRHSKEKATKAQNNATPAVIIRWRQVPSGCAGSSGIWELMSRRNAYATRLAQPMENKKSAVDRPSSERQNTMAGNGNRTQPSQAGNR